MVKLNIQCYAALVTMCFIALTTKCASASDIIMTIKPGQYALQCMDNGNDSKPLFLSTYKESEVWFTISGSAGLVSAVAVAALFSTPTGMAASLLLMAASFVPLTFQTKNLQLASKPTIFTIGVPSASKGLTDSFELQTPGSFHYVAMRDQWTETVAVSNGNTHDFTGYTTVNSGFKRTFDVVHPASVYVSIVSATPIQAHVSTRNADQVTLSLNEYSLFVPQYFKKIRSVTLNRINASEWKLVKIDE